MILLVSLVGLTCSCRAALLRNLKQWAGLCFNWKVEYETGRYVACAEHCLPVRVRLFRFLSAVWNRLTLLLSEQALGV